MDGIPVSNPHNAHEPVAALRIFYQVDGCENAERNCDQQRKPCHDYRVDQSRHQGYIFRCVFPCEQARSQIGDSLDQNIRD